MKIILTGGGTGGHIYPNLALFVAVFEKQRESKLLYVGSNAGMEKEIAKIYEIPFAGIYCGKLRRYFSFKTLIDFIKIPLGFFQSMRIIYKFKADVIFSKGGYVGVPVVFAAWLLRKRIIIHESDSIPGLATKLCSYFADTICLAYQESEKYLNKKKTLLTGIPLRREILKGSKEKGLKLCGFKADLPVVLIFGGSLGAKFINDLALESLKDLLTHTQIVHLTGKGKFENTEIVKARNYKAFEEVGSKITHFYAMADLIISRAGANAIAEIQTWAKPCVLIPLPKSASRGDQIKNAEILEKKHGCVVLNQNEVTGKKFTKTILELLNNPKKLANLKENIKTEIHKTAAERITNLILQTDINH